jgi:tRNA (guanine26-N2/guanine27-N2)-dimethyltransferase
MERLLSFSFQTEVVKEGKASFAAPKLETYMTSIKEYTPSRAPVFYNPIMELNRDIAVLALQVYQRSLGRKIRVCEPLTGCGVRGIRLAAEVEGIKKVVVNDISREATKLARFNVEQNNMTKLVSVVNEDANLFLNRYAVPHKRFDYIDVDPFGSPVAYIDSAVRALRDGGLLALTATDMAPLCGVYPKACIRKYGGKPLRTEYCHELAVRLLAGCLGTIAARYEMGTRVLFSHSTNHYIRLYTMVNYGAKQADISIQKMGYIFHCFACFHRETSEGIFSHLRQECPECDSRLKTAGPLWLGGLFDEVFCSLMEKDAKERHLKQEKRIIKLLSLAKNEAKAPLTYFVVDKFCDKLNLPAPSTIKVVEELQNRGFQAVLTHFNSKGVRTDASAKAMKEVITKILKN